MVAAQHTDAAVVDACALVPSAAERGDERRAEQGGAAADSSMDRRGLEHQANYKRMMPTSPSMAILVPNGSETCCSHSSVSWAT